MICSNISSTSGSGSDRVKTCADQKPDLIVCWIRCLLASCGISQKPYHADSTSTAVTFRRFLVGDKECGRGKRLRKGRMKERLGRWFRGNRRTGRCHSCGVRVSTLSFSDDINSVLPHSLDFIQRHEFKTEENLKTDGHILTNVDTVYNVFHYIFI